MSVISSKTENFSNSSSIDFVDLLNKNTFTEFLPVQKNEPDTEKQQPKDSTTTNDGAVTEITPECLIKHPLQHQWTLWYLEPDRSKTWEEMQNEVSSFDTVEDFWSLYNHIKGASEIKQGSDYSLFKKNIRPMWEDEGNKRGGRWIMSFPRPSRRQELDSLWLDVVLCLIGEAFDYPDDICGAVVNVRPRGDKIGEFRIIAFMIVKTEVVSFFFL